MEFWSILLLIVDFDFFSVLFKILFSPIIKMYFQKLLLSSLPVLSMLSITGY